MPRTLCYLIAAAMPLLSGCGDPEPQFTIVVIPKGLTHEHWQSVRRGAEQAGYAHMDIVSGAGHDACYVSRVAPTAMIFVPCKDCISHNEIEDATKDDVGAGCQILLQAMVERANR